MSYLNGNTIYLHFIEMESALYEKSIKTILQHVKLIFLPKFVTIATGVCEYIRCIESEQVEVGYTILYKTNYY